MTDRELLEAAASVEPVAIALHTGTKQGIKWLAKAVEHGTNLYTADQMRAYAEAAVNEASRERLMHQPLTDEQIARCMLMVDDPLLWGRMDDDGFVALKQFTRAIEAAHGIKE